MDRATIAEDRRLMFSLMLLTFVTGLVDAASVLGLRTRGAVCCTDSPSKVPAAAETLPVPFAWWRA